MNPPLLSICIPTFNRADCLKLCLLSIVSQFQDPEVPGSVEVVISDNNSSDNTFAVVEEFQKNYRFISYKKNDSNLGVDRNILQVVEMAHGQYVWLLGDDDALFPGAIKYLLSEIQKQKFKYCVVNFWGYDSNLEHQALKYPSRAILKDQYFNQLQDFVREFKHDENLVGFFCGLSVQVFERSLWMVLPDKNQFIGTSAMHMHTLLIAMKNQSFAVLAKPLVKARSDNIRWDSFEGLGSAKKRAQGTFKALLWILDFYHLPHSKFLIKCNYYFYIFKNFIRSFIKKHLFKSQKSRDLIKRILGKL
ncbi:MAG: glycosyltransferase family 2 protein [Patescibacteria group bacterium]